MTDPTRRDDMPDFEQMSDEDLAEEILDLEEEIAAITDQLSDDLQGIGDRKEGWSSKAATVRNYKRSYLRAAKREQEARVGDLAKIERENADRVRRETLAIEIARKEAAKAEIAAAAAWAAARSVPGVKAKKKVGE